MYEERKNSFSIKDIILQLLLVFLFIFIMIWLFPTKSYLDDKYVTKDQLSEELMARLEALYGRMYADNVESMSLAAKGYFTTPRLPKKVGDTVTLTLAEMYEKKLVLELVDSNNKACDTEKSYVQLTKMDDEYQMKVQLTCSDFSDYIIVYMGCYDYCDTAICEKEPIKVPTTTDPTLDKPSDDKPNKEEPKPVPTVTYKYKYRKTTQNEWSDWSDWSSWSTKEIKTDNLTQVQTKQEKVITGYKQEKVITGYKNKKVVKTKEVEKEVVVGTTKVPDGVVELDRVPAKKVTTGSTSGSYTDWVYVGYVEKNYPLSNSDTVKYVYESDYTTIDCNDVCKNVTTYVYKKYTRNYVKGDTITTWSCAAYGEGYKLDGKDCVYETMSYIDVNVYEKQMVEEEYTEIEKVPVWGYVDGDPIFEITTYYRYRTRKQISFAGVHEKWSYSANDQKLISQGYVLIDKVEV